MLQAAMPACILLAAPGMAFADSGPAGTSEAFSVIDAIAIGVIVFILFRLVSRGFGRGNRPNERQDRRPPQRRDNVSRLPGRDDADRNGNEEREPTRKEASDAYRRAQQTWDYLSSKPRGERPGRQTPPGDSGPESSPSEPPPIDVESTPAGGPPVGVPAGSETVLGGTTSARVDVRGFDEEDFLKGAKAVYARIQESWDARDLEDIREFVGDQVYENLQQHARKNPTPGKTEILLIEAKVLEVKRDGPDLTASVLYEVLLRKKNAKANSKLKEIWHFRKPTDDKKAFWKVEGIQQVH